MRWICLWQVPDVSVPFDARDVIGPTVPPDQDALTYYMSAAQILEQNSPDWLWDAMNGAMEYRGPWDERLDQWLRDNSKLLEELELGSSRSSVSKCLSKDDWAHNPVGQNLRQLTRVSVTQAKAFERSENLDEAWKWHRVTLRLADHTDRQESLYYSVVGAAIRYVAAESIRDWASNPSLPAEQLRLARAEFTQLTSRRTPISQIMKTEYLLCKSELESESGPDCLFPELDHGLLANLPANCRRFFCWSIGQPELSLRLMRQILVNNSDQIDQPLHLRGQTVSSKYPFIFQLDPGQPRQRGQLGATSLDRSLNGPLGRRLTRTGLLSRFGIFYDHNLDFKDVYLLQNARVTMTIVVLAAHEFQRVHGVFPTDVKQLIPVYLETEPLDPMSRTGEQLHYRVDESGNAWVWTVGVDGLIEGAATLPNTASENCFKISLSDDIDGER